MYKCSDRRFDGRSKRRYLARNPITAGSTLKRTKIAQRSRRLVADVLDKDGKLKEPGEERRLLAVASDSIKRTRT